ncbi:unnamed protein product [Diplocarpon coronariae]
MGHLSSDHFPRSEGLIASERGGGGEEEEDEDEEEEQEESKDPERGIAETRACQQAQALLGSWYQHDPSRPGSSLDQETPPGGDEIGGHGMLRGTDARLYTDEADNAPPPPTVSSGGGQRRGAAAEQRVRRSVPCSAPVPATLSTAVAKDEKTDVGGEVIGEELGGERSKLRHPPVLDIGFVVLATVKSTSGLGGGGMSCAEYDKRRDYRGPKLDTISNAATWLGCEHDLCSGLPGQIPFQERNFPSLLARLRSVLERVAPRKVAARTGEPAREVEQEVDRTEQRPEGMAYSGLLFATAQAWLAWAE